MATSKTTTTASVLTDTVTPGTTSAPRATTGKRGENGKPSVTERAADTLHETIDRVAEKAASAEQSLRDRASDADSQVRDTADRAKQQGAATMQKVETFVHEHPLAALGIAFSIGLVGSAILRR